MKKTVHDKLVTKVNDIDTTEFDLKTKYDTDKSDLEKKTSHAEQKIRNTSGLVKKTDSNAKVSDIESKILSISGLVTNAALMQLKVKYLMLIV